jgi:hypothetical protein
LFLLPVASASAETLTVECTFSKGDLTFAKSHGYDLVTIEQGVLEGRPGAPSVPAKTVRVSVPAGATFAGLTYTAQTEALPGNYSLAPAQRPMVLGQPAQWTAPDPVAYADDRFAPQAPVEYVARHQQRGFTTLSFKVRPLAFNPIRKELRLHTRLTLQVEYQAAKTSSAIHPRNADFFRAATERRVLNPQDVTDNAPPVRAAASQTGENGADGLIIYVDPEVKGPMWQLARWYTEKGYPTRLLSLPEIWDGYSGDDYAERIRNCIIQHVNDHGTLFVIMATDYAISVRYTYVWTDGAALDGEWEFVETYQMPTDAYYAGLDGDWDANGNGIYGEAPQDDPPTISDEVDLDYDVIVARYPVHNAQDAQAMVDKVICYETAFPTSDLARRLLFTGASLWNYYGPGTHNGIDFDHWASDCEIKNECLIRDTVGPLWPSATFDRLYDTYTTWDTSYAGDFEMTVDNINSKWSDGYHMLCMSTHGNGNLWSTEWWPWYYCEDVADLHNTDKAGIVLTIACNTAAFDWGDCLSEAFLWSPQCGSVIYLGCSRYGLGFPDLRRGPSMDYMASFFQELLGNDVHLSGANFIEHKMDWAVESAVNGPWRWLQYGINLQGDPLVDIYTDDPQPLAPIHPDGLQAGQVVFEVAGIPADARCCLWKQGQIYEVWQGPQAVPIDAWAGEMMLTITAHNHLVYQDKIYVFDPSCPGDLNGDRFRDLNDFVLFAAAYGSTVGDLEYSPVIDMSPPGGDGTIDLDDFGVFAQNYLQLCP